MARRASLRPDAGMTLVEVLMVVFIAGLVAGVAVMTLPQRESAHEKAVREVRQTVRDLRDRSLITGEVLGLAVTAQGLEVQRWTGESWETAARPLRLGGDVHITARPVGGRQTSDREDEEVLLVFNPLGTSDPVLLEVGTGPQRATLRLTPEGEVADAG